MLDTKPLIVKMYYMTSNRERSLLQKDCLLNEANHDDVLEFQISFVFSFRQSPKQTIFPVEWERSSVWKTGAAYNISACLVKARCSTRFDNERR